MSQEINQEALDALLSGVYYMCKSMVENTTLIYDGIITSKSADAQGKWTVKYNNKTHAIKPYGTIVPSFGKMVKIFIPQGNQALAFFM